MVYKCFQLYGWDKWYSQLDINALIKLWGRENDEGQISIESHSFSHRYIQDGNKYFINTDIGREDITGLSKINFADQTIDVQTDIIDLFKLVKGIDDITGKIYRLYSAAFGRFPDKDGYKYWIQFESNRKNL